MADINARPPDEGNEAGLTLRTRWVYGFNGRDGMNRHYLVAMTWQHTEQKKKGVLKKLMIPYKKKGIPMGRPFECVLSSKELFFLGGGFLVGFEEGLLWYAHEHR